MSVISVRVDEEDEAWLRKRGLKPGAFARRAIHEAIRRAEIEEAHAWLAKHTFRSDVDAVEFFRRDRETH